MSGDVITHQMHNLMLSPPKLTVSQSGREQFMKHFGKACCISCDFLVMHNIFSIALLGLLLGLCY